MDIEIVRITRANAALLERAAEDVFDDPVRPDRVAAYVDEPGHILLVAVVAGEVVGQGAAVVHRHPDKPAELYVDEMGVTPALWRRGIGGLLLDELFRIGRDLGCEEVWLGTEPDNIEALALYRSRRGGERLATIFEWEF